MCHAHRLIQIERQRLDPRERERWRERFASTPIIARPALWTDPELFVFFGLAWLAVTVVTFDHWLSDPSPLVIGGVRILATAAAVMSFRAAFRMDTTRGAHGPQGCFLFAWGFVQIDCDVARIVPASELRIGLRARWGPMPIRLVLGDARWSTTFAIDTEELTRVAAALGDDSRLESLDGGYRDGRPRIDGAPTRWPLFRTVRELAWAAPVCPSMTLAPAHFGADPAPKTLAASAAATSAPGVPFRSLLRPEWEEHLLGPGGVSIEPDVDFEDCAGAPTVRATASYLELALSAPSLGSARNVRPRTYRTGHATIWASRAWRVDPEHGTFSSVDVEWGLDRYSSTWRSRRATVGASHVLDAIERCRRHDEPIDVGPRALAERSARIATRVVLHDVMRDLPEDDSSCEREIAWAIVPSRR